jgi:hypothetical protein
LPEATHKLIEFVEPFWRNEQRNGLADDLLRAISIDLLRRRVPAGDDPIGVLLKIASSEEFTSAASQSAASVGRVAGS